jgi:hypothetical protein
MLIFLRYFLFISLFFSCGKNKSTRTNIHNDKDSLLGLNSQNGLYQAFLNPINPGEVSIKGSLNITKENDVFATSVRLSKGSGLTLQLQNIHMGKRCPNHSDDLNGDGFIDAHEGASVYQEIIIPLDDDLNSQRMGGGIYPFTDMFGFYTWSREASFQKMMLDLNEIDLNANDDFIKLSSNQFDLNNKVVVISGISKEKPLPETVLGRGRLDSHESFPIACGVIQKITKTPGTVDIDHTGLPIPFGEDSILREDDGTFFNTETSTPEVSNYGDD